ncbi:hypothetical protein C2845_PM17G08730 [Panicum miliaceum]|uniref:Protein kinase domain-containing protein n=1 Tax=Panicum miliaceum TaxID=4540 RepID=A0A3L6Q317_PANMI|nr:hypothetical protein C2845_PM17G08730 [Panicum miliaceum]
MLLKHMSSGLLSMFLFAVLITWRSVFLSSAPPYMTAHPSLQSPWKKREMYRELSGSFGQVYLASNRESSLNCAIKEILHPHSKEQIMQLYREVYFLSKFSHPNIVRYYGINLTGGKLSIYMEYMSEGSIHKLLKDGPFNENRIRHCTVQILFGLAYLHGRKIAHRDIKGGNILVGPKGEVKLADFGLAKNISSVAEVHSDKGTPFWMAPEVIKSKFSGSGYNLLADIWSLGCTVIEMATGAHPWHEHCIPGEPCNQVAGMFRIAIRKDTPKIPEYLSEEGKDFLQHCLQRDPGSRPTFVRDYRAAF